MKQFKTIFFLLVILLLGGCASYMRPVKALPEANNGGNNVTILRNYNYISGGMRFWPTVDGQEISGLFPKEHVSFVLPSGKHSVGVRCGWSDDQMEIIIKESEIRYFKISPYLLNPIGCAEIEEITATEAIDRLKKSTLIKTGFMSDCDRKSVTFESKPDYTCFSNAIGMQVDSVSLRYTVPLRP
jgi:hypothetical protein